MSDARLHRCTDVLVQDLDGQLLLLRSGSADVVHLDAVASDAWRVLEQPLTRRELAEVLASQYDVEPARVSADLAPLLETLLLHGLVAERPIS